MREKQSKLLRIFLVVALFFGSLGLSAQTVTKTFRNESLKNVLKEVERQTRMSAIYKVDEVNTNKKVTATFRSTPVREVLNQVLGDDLSYEIDSKMITIHKRAVQQKINEPKKIVKGQVFDETGEPVIGATVRVKGASEAAVTDLDGNFSIDAPEGSKIEISYMGYAPKEITANQSNVKVNLTPDQKMLNEVVVTALGIKKETKALSYNVQQVTSDDINKVKDANFMNALAGKIAGVEINSSSSGVGGGVKVVMRGAKSLSGNNNALYVIDGVPMPSLSGGNQPDDIFTGMGQSGDGAAMINSDDIENISVLSGAAASALYGMDAANGVIMITTKKGKQGKPHVSYSNNTTFYSPFVTPDFQNTYGQTSSTSMYSWGSKLASPSSYDPLDFYQTGYNEGNSLTFSVGSDKNQTFVSAASTNAEGIVENNGVRRYNFAIRNSTDFLGDKLHLDLSAMYMNVKEQNMISSGYYFNPIVATYLFPPGDDIRKYMPYEQYDQERNIKTQYWPFGNMGLSMQNPYWIVNRDMFQNHKDRFILSGGLTWKLAKGFSLAGRAKVDNTTSIYEKKYSASTETLFASTYGAFYRANEDTRQVYADAILNMDKYFGDFSVNANLGTSIKDENYSYNNVGGYLSSAASTASTDLAHGFTLGNVTKSTATIEQNDYHHQVQSVFATAQVGYKSMVYLDATARNDWDSYLGNTKYKNKGFFYPSVGLSFILTDMVPGLKSNALSFLKLRGSYSEVGNSPQAFAAALTYPYANGSISTSTQYPNRDLEPERTKSWEVGLETHFWGNKLNMNVSLYKTRTTNQYFTPQLSATSGYTSIGINGGLIENKGVEASLTLNQPLGPVQWTSIFNYTLNRNKIKKLLRPTTIASGETISLDALDVLNLGPVKVRLTEGGSIGDLYVTTLKTDEHGYVIVDYTSKQVAGVDDGKYVYAGNTSPKYSMSWRNNFSWNGFHLGVLVTGRFGGRVVSLTQGWMDSYGVSQSTADARNEGGALVNGVRIPAQAFYSVVGPSVGSWYVYKATNVRLAELSFGYDIPIRKYVPWIEGLNVSFVGRNLLMFYNKAPFDPELTASTGTYYSGIDNFMMPSLRNLGFSVKVDF
jgi:TonB-linked SusC/RagA family outer membrane protein